MHFAMSKPTFYSITSKFTYNINKNNICTESEVCRMNFICWPEISSIKWITWMRIFLVLNVYFLEVNFEDLNFQNSLETILQGNRSVVLWEEEIENVICRNG